jgi:ribosome maturation factor RimP
MIDRAKIENSVKEYIRGTDLFIVDIRISSSNRITILVDTKEGITIDKCAELHHSIEKSLDRNVEDFELQVSSPGLDMPFGVIEQYYKNEGQKVTVVDIEGMKYTGVLKNVTKGGFELETETKAKGKAKEIRDVSFNFDQIKSTKVVLTI